MRGKAQPEGLVEVLRITRITVTPPLAAAGRAHPLKSAPQRDDWACCPVRQHDGFTVCRPEGDGRGRVAHELCVRTGAPPSKAKSPEPCPSRATRSPAQARPGQPLDMPYGLRMITLLRPSTPAHASRFTPTQGRYREKKAAHSTRWCASSYPHNRVSQRIV